MQKWRDTGSHQAGHLQGTRCILQRLQSDKIYLAADYLQASGVMQGRDHRARPLVSDVTDTAIEGRVGYCFETKSCSPSIFVPFIGYGHFEESTECIAPSPLRITYTDKFDYTIAGFIAAIMFSPSLELGFNFKAIFMNNAISLIEDPDPDFGNSTLMIRDVPYIRVEFPSVFYLSPSWPHTYLKIAPFYEYRHFGGKEGVLFNFHDTQFNLFGLNTSLIFTY